MITFYLSKFLSNTSFSLNSLSLVLTLIKNFANFSFQFSFSFKFFKIALHRHFINGLDTFDNNTFNTIHIVQEKLKTHIDNSIKGIKTVGDECM